MGAAGCSLQGWVLCLEGGGTAARGVRVWMVQGAGLRMCGAVAGVSALEVVTTCNEAVEGCLLRVQGQGFRVAGFRFRVAGFGFPVSGFRFRVSGFGFRVGAID